MIKKLEKLIPVFFLLLFACSLAPSKLKIAEELLENNPDSALYMLQHMPSVKKMSEANRALYGFLVFQALDNKDKSLQPDSLIDFSINYYFGTNNKLNLAKSYFLKARMYKKRQRFEDAVTLYLKSLDLINSTDNYLLLGRIYSDLGDICILQKDYNESFKKIFKSIDCFNKAGNKVEASYRVVTIGKIYRVRKDLKKAQKYYKQALSITSDSLLQGFAFQEIGVTYYWAKQYDSAQYYLRKSLRFPYTGTNYAIRCFVLADLMYDIGRLDSAATYALLSLKYPGTYYNRRDCYRILTNCEYWKNNIEQMGKYMSLYQDYTDSVRKIEIQAKASLLESLHNKNQETTGTKRSMIWIVSMLILVLLFSTIIVYFLIQRNKFKKRQLAIYKQELNQKQEFVNQSLHNKITEAREAQSEARRNASPEERARLDKELYERCLHLSNWDSFSCEMNHAFNQIVDVLQSNYSGITQKEITWCCFHLLDIPTTDRILLLDATTDSLYKLKQRLAQKMNLKSTRELDSHLKSYASIEI
jgi:tetratricopeptide (TPR) repeat protein